jgi:hypothetical protein
MINLWKVDDDKVFYVMFKQDEEKIYKVHARSEGEAIRVAFGFVEDNNLIDFTKSKKDLLIGAVENIEDFNKEIIENFNGIGQLIEGTDTDIYVDFLKDEKKKTDEDKTENSDEDEELSADDFQELCCKNCEYYCPICNECTYEE